MARIAGSRLPLSPAAASDLARAANVRVAILVDLERRCRTGAAAGPCAQHGLKNPREVKPLADPSKKGYL